MCDDVPGEGWQFWIDRGGTFTDVVARAPDGRIVTEKLLSAAPSQYEDSAVEAIRRILGLAAGEPIAPERVHSVKMGTTVATNALLERKGERVALAITRGLPDALRIGYQTRPNLFALRIVLPETLYERVIEIDERLGADGASIVPLDESAARRGLEDAYAAGYRSLAIVLMHAYREPAHERRLAELAREVGFTQVTTSSEVSRLIKLIPRGDTAVLDAYLSPILRRYVASVAAKLGGAPLMFMQSNGGLADASRFHGRDAILSGPAGGVVGMAETARAAGFEKAIGFDMGGTSTDVSHFDGAYERAFESEIAGVKVRSPMMRIHTVAAGGGSVLSFDGARFRVGPASAGADPGPTCYRRGGPLTVTDANVLLGRIQPEFFPALFGPGADQPIDVTAVREGFARMADEVGRATGATRPAVSIAEGFIEVAVDNMANAIRRISVQRGYNVRDYVLNCFGGAGGQHACRIADALGMSKVLIHPLSGVLSALGMGLAEIRSMRERTVEKPLMQAIVPELGALAADLAAETEADVAAQGAPAASLVTARRAHLKYRGSDAFLIVDLDTAEAMAASFAGLHRERFGFAIDDRPVIVDALTVETIGRAAALDEPSTAPCEIDGRAVARLATVQAWFDGGWRPTPLYERAALAAGSAVQGPAIIVEANATTIVERGWRAEATARGDLLLHRERSAEAKFSVSAAADPVRLEIFNNLFMSIAEQMGAVLANTAQSVNIKERLDFSCALFDRAGGLVANAPHVPVHLGSMGESVEAVIRKFGIRAKPGDAFTLNAPYEGGTHLPDVTVISPVFDDEGDAPIFWVGSRGHHADIGGRTPGSMPPDSKTIEDEGVVIEPTPLVAGGRFREEAIREILATARFPARSPDQNVADLKAQVAANARGVAELRRVVAAHGREAVEAYMGHIQDNAEAHVRRVIDRVGDGAFAYELDTGAVVRVAIRVDRAAREAVIDFTGTSPAGDDNFNAPPAIATAAVMYAFRCLVEDDIPLNAGCLRPLRLIVPAGSMLSPGPSAAVAAGNVETSQVITDALFGALGALAGAQGTMNNLTFGNGEIQYYETICGGAGAGPGFDGVDAVHTHMTNTRLTDPEILEQRFPVILRAFAIRRGSGGRGRNRGGDGIVREIEFLRPMTVGIVSNRRRVPPFGLAGGEPGKCGANWVRRADGTIERLGAVGVTEVAAGDALTIETPGGGGYGRVNRHDLWLRVVGQPTEPR